jgi:hypothetical protein
VCGRGKLRFRVKEMITAHLYSAAASTTEIQIDGNRPSLQASQSTYRLMRIPWLPACSQSG